MGRQSESHQVGLIDLLIMELIDWFVKRLVVGFISRHRLDGEQRLLP